MGVSHGQPPLAIGGPRVAHRRCLHKDDVGGYVREKLSGAQQAQRWQAHGWLPMATPAQPVEWRTSSRCLRRRRSMSLTSLNTRPVSSRPVGVEHRARSQWVAAEQAGEGTLSRFLGM